VVTDPILEWGRRIVNNESFEFSLLTTATVGHDICSARRCYLDLVEASIADVGANFTLHPGGADVDDILGKLRGTGSGCEACDPTP